MVLLCSNLLNGFKRVIQTWNSQSETVVRDKTPLATKIDYRQTQIQPSNYTNFREEKFLCHWRTRQ